MATKPDAKVITTRDVELTISVREFGPDDVRRVRQLLGLSQPLFARFLGVGLSTLTNWEHGRKPTSPIARRFLHEIERAPDHWRARLRQMVSVRESGPPRPRPDSCNCCD
jgi:putative transcriptional regulator